MTPSRKREFPTHRDGYAEPMKRIILLLAVAVAVAIAYKILTSEIPIEES